MRLEQLEENLDQIIDILKMDKRTVENYFDDFKTRYDNQYENTFADGLKYALMIIESWKDFVPAYDFEISKKYIEEPRFKKIYKNFKYSKAIISFNVFLGEMLLKNDVTSVLKWDKDVDGTYLTLEDIKNQLVGANKDVYVMYKIIVSNHYNEFLFKYEIETGEWVEYINECEV